MLKLKLALAVILIVAALVVSGCCCCVIPGRHYYRIPRYMEVGSRENMAQGSPTATVMPTMLPI